LQLLDELTFVPFNYCSSHRTNRHRNGGKTMTQLPRKELYEITLKNLAPPYLNYEYFNNSGIAAEFPPAGIYRHVGEIRYIDSDGVLHDNADLRSSWADEIQGQFKNVINALRQSGKGLTGALF
jgi:hypothetical protein